MNTNDIRKRIEGLIEKYQKQHDENQQKIKSCPKCQELDKAKKSDTCEFHLILHQIAVGRIGVLKETLNLIPPDHVLIKKKDLHRCSFGFEKGQLGPKNYKKKEPVKGQRGYSEKRDDWVCRCGKTRRKWLDEHAHTLYVTMKALRSKP